MSYINAPTAASDDLTSGEEAYINSLVAQSYTSGSLLLAGGTGVIPTQLIVGSTNEILTVKSDNSLHFKPISAGSNITISQDDTEIQISADILESGTVTSVSVVTENGVSGTVATATTTPAITLTLGAITPSAVQISGLTASELVATDASKNLVSLAVATYPSLTELTYVKGVSSAIQTQIDGKSPTAGNTSLVTVGTITTGIWNGTDIAVADGGTGGGVAGITLFNNISGFTAAGGTGTTTTNLVFSTSPTLITPVLGTPTSGTLTNCTGLPVAGLVSDTTTALGLGSIELGHATDTTISRVSAGVVSVEGINVVTISSTDTLSNKTLTSPTLTTPSAFTTGGTITLAENTSIALDPAGSADGKYTGITITGTAGATLAFGDLIYLAVADSRWELTDANATATAGTPLIGMCVLAAVADGNPTTILLYGQIRADVKFPALTIGAPVYVGETAGAIQVAIPTGADNVIRVVGRALTADEILFNPSQDHQITVA